MKNHETQVDLSLNLDTHNKWSGATENNWEANVIQSKVNSNSQNE